MQEGLISRPYHSMNWREYLSHISFYYISYDLNFNAQGKQLKGS